jgi:hypothetical protein
MNREDSVQAPIIFLRKEYFLSGGDSDIGAGVQYNFNCIKIPH